MVKNLAILGGLGALGAAIAQELRKPAEERTWHGKVAGFVPYEFRRPTVQRARERMWNPDDPHIVQPQPFGVGWTVNLGRVARIVRERKGSSAAS